MSSLCVQLQSHLPIPHLSMCLKSLQLPSLSTGGLWTAFTTTGLVGYAVRYGVQGTHNTLTLYISGDNVTETTLSSLLSSTEYVIEVAVLTVLVSEYSAQKYLLGLDQVSYIYS